MRKLNVVNFVTLDGVMQGPGHSDEDREGGRAIPMKLASTKATGTGALILTYVPGPV